MSNLKKISGITLPQITVSGTYYEQNIYGDDVEYLSHANKIWAQTFLANYGGSLNKISFEVFNPGTATKSLIIQVRTTDEDGKPTETILGSITVLAASINEYVGFVDFGLSSPIVLTANTIYAIVILPDVTDTGDYYFMTSAIDFYTSGKMFVKTGDSWAEQKGGAGYFDLNFKCEIIDVNRSIIENGILKVNLVVEPNVKIDGVDVSETLVKNSISGSFITTDGKTIIIVNGQVTEINE